MMGRWTIGGGLALIATVAVSLAAIRDASPVWATVVLLLVGSLYTFAAAMALLRPGRRSGWMGFVGCGGAYFLYALMMVPMVGPIPVISAMVESAATRLEPSPPPIREAWLPREKWIELPIEERRERSVMISIDSEKGRQYAVAMQSRRLAFRSITHSLLSLLIGLFGALLAGLLRRPGLRPSETGVREWKEADAPCP